MKRTTYAALSHTGLIRRHNEDRYVCLCGKSTYRWNNNDVQDSAVRSSGASEPEETVSFAIFDGMGGEACGEIAASLAADAFTEESCRLSPDDLCRKLNAPVVGYSHDHRISFMGSTAVWLTLKDGLATCGNIGDSRIYRIRRGRITQLTKDHSRRNAITGSRMLTQCLGIPEDEMRLVPFSVKLYTSENDTYLICSDGLTDMLTDDQIRDIVTHNSSLSEAAEQLLASALAAGGQDNITLILIRTA